MYKSQHDYWVGWLRRVGHAKEKKRKEMGWCIKAIRPKGELKKNEIGWSKVKASGMYLLWIDIKSVKGRKEGKDEEIKGEAILPVSKRSPREWDWGQCSLEELREGEQAKGKRKILKARENCERYTVKIES